MVFEFGILGERMNRNFFIRLVFATHRVIDALPVSPPEKQLKEEIREAANVILADLILLTAKDFTKPEKKQDLLFQVERQIDVLLLYLEKAKQEGWVNPENFSLLVAEYGRIRELLEIFEDIQGESENKIKEQPKLEKKEPVSIKEIGQQEKNQELGVTPRQKRIIEFLRTKADVQVWELQKVLPEVTKRTLRRDLDELLEKNIVARKGAWNTVSYVLK